MPSRADVRIKLDEKLGEMALSGQFPDVITFAGNGEPTLHPEFAGIIDDTIELRDRLAPHARIAVLSNASMLHRPEVFNALLKVDDNIQKLDSAFEETVKLLDCPAESFRLDRVVNQLMKFGGKVIVQTLFIKGSYKGTPVDNTTRAEVDAWLDLINRIKPGQVMIYTIARDTPVDTLEKVSPEVLDNIALQVKKAGWEVQVTY